MGVASLVSTIFDLKPSGFGRWFLALCLTLLAAGCATKQVEVEGNFPVPLLDPLPITLGVIYPSAFAKHEFFDEAKGRAESDDVRAPDVDVVDHQQPVADPCDRVHSRE